MRHAVIMAGGAGTRLWPLSRRTRPKQLLRLFDGASLLQIARQRLADLFPPANVWVITSAHYLDQVAAQLPDLPRANLIGEPVGRDTANAIGLAAGLLARRDADATMAVFTADHLIRPQDAFQAAIRAGLEAAETRPASLVTFGITPTSAHTGYGYIRRGEPVAAQAYRVAAFKEKPTRETAEEYFASDEYYWNSGMFAWRAATILAELGRALPENAPALAQLADHWPRLAGTDEARQRFAALRKVSIDYAVMENAAEAVVVPMDCEWRDLGSWSAIAATRPADAHGNATMAARTLLVDSGRNVVISESEHAIVLLGVHDLVVVHSADATLICHARDVERIKDLAEARLAAFGDRYE